MAVTLSREISIVPEKSALLFIDVQNYNARPDGGEYKEKGLTSAEAEEKYTYFFTVLKEVAFPNMQRLQNACRQKNIEVMYTVIESLTKDGRDRSLDYKISGFNVPKDSPDLFECRHLNQYPLYSGQPSRRISDCQWLAVGPMY